MSGGFGSSDSFLFQNVLAEDVASEAFRTLKSELCWHEMMHKGGAVPRLLSIQGRDDHQSITSFVIDVDI